MSNSIKIALSIQCAFYRLQHDYNIDALFELNMAVLEKCLIPVVFLDACNDKCTVQQNPAF